MSGPVVYVVHEVPQQDLSPAENFGRLEYINKRYIYSDETVDGIPTDYRNRIIDAVLKFKPDVDYLLIAGDHLQIVVMSALLARAHHQFQVLRYDRNISGYVPVVVDAK